MRDDNKTKKSWERVAPMTQRAREAIRENHPAVGWLVLIGIIVLVLGLAACLPWK